MVFGLDKKTKKNKSSALVFQPGFKDGPPPSSTVMPDEPAPMFTPPENFTTAPEPAIEDPNGVVWVENVFGQKLKTKRKKVSKNDTVIADPKAPGGPLEVVQFINEFGQVLQGRREMINNQSQIIVNPTADTEDTVEVDNTGNLTVSKKKKSKNKADYTGLYIIGGIVFGSFLIVGLAGN
jgi:hypothetical protein